MSLPWVFFLGSHAAVGQSHQHQVELAVTVNRITTLTCDFPF
jgi:hypothetical protein